MIFIRKPEWPNKVFHSPKVRKAVAAELARRSGLPRQERHGVSRRIPSALPGEYRTHQQIKRDNRFQRQGGTVTAKGKDGTGNSKWYRRVEAMKQKAAEA